MRLGVYELIELHKPAHVVHEHVEMAKAFGMAKLVNAVLRRIARDQETGSVPVPNVGMVASVVC